MFVNEETIVKPQNSDGWQEQVVMMSGVGTSILM